MKPVLEVKNLTTSIQVGKKCVPIVDHLSFNLYPGKTLALVGESGCGKSFTALSLMRILPSPPAYPSTGEVIYNNKNLLTLPERQMRTIRGGRIAMIFQNPASALNPVYTIGNQMMEVIKIHLKVVGEEAENYVFAALDDVGIASPQKRFFDYPHQLSGGMKQRIMIAMALMVNPDILIADEPTTALDVTIQAQILELIRLKQRTKGMALLFITHDMGIVAEMADEVMVMYAAQRIENDHVNGLFDHLLHPYTQGLFAARPRLERCDKEKPLYTIQGSVPPPDHFPDGCRFHPRCPFVMERCRSGPVPDYYEHGSHLVKCWLYDGSEESSQQRFKFL